MLILAVALANGGIVEKAAEEEHSIWIDLSNIPQDVGPFYR